MLLTKKETSSQKKIKKQISPATILVRFFNNGASSSPLPLSSTLPSSATTPHNPPPNSNGMITAKADRTKASLAGRIFIKTTKAHRRISQPYTGTFSPTVHWTVLAGVWSSTRENHIFPGRTPRGWVCGPAHVLFAAPPRRSMDIFGGIVVESGVIRSVSTSKRHWCVCCWRASCWRESCCPTWVRGPRFLRIKCIFDVVLIGIRRHSW